jgi:hypothetical protein
VSYFTINFDDNRGIGLNSDIACFLGGTLHGSQCAFLKFAHLLFVVVWNVFLGNFI